MVIDLYWCNTVAIIGPHHKVGAVKHVAYQDFIEIYLLFGRRTSHMKAHYDATAPKLFDYSKWILQNRTLNDRIILVQVEMVDLKHIFLFMKRFNSDV